MDIYYDQLGTLDKITVLDKDNKEMFIFIYQEDDIIYAGEVNTIDICPNTNKVRIIRDNGGYINEDGAIKYFEEMGRKLTKIEHIQHLNRIKRWKKHVIKR